MAHLRKVLFWSALLLVGICISVDNDTSRYGCYTIEDCEAYSTPFMSVRNRVFSNIDILISKVRLPARLAADPRIVDPIQWDVVAELLDDIELDDLQRDTSQWKRTILRDMHLYVGEVVAVEYEDSNVNGHSTTVLGTITGFARPLDSKYVYAFSVFHRDIPDKEQKKTEYYAFAINPERHYRTVGRLAMMRNAGDVDCGVIMLGDVGMIPHNEYKDPSTGKVSAVDELFRNETGDYPSICLSPYGIWNARIGSEHLGDIFVEIDPNHELPKQKRGLSGTPCFHRTKAGSIKDIVLIKYVEVNVFMARRNALCTDEATHTLGHHFTPNLLRKPIATGRQSKNEL